MKAPRDGGRRAGFSAVQDRWWIASLSGAKVRPQCSHVAMFASSAA